MVVSRSKLVINHKICYGSTFYDHIPLYFEAIMNIQVYGNYLDKPPTDVTNIRRID